MSSTVAVLTAAAHAAGIPPLLLLAVCTVESGLRNTINVNDGGSASYGLCQVKGATARLVEPNVHISDLMKESVNARIAAKYLARQLRRYHGDARCAVAAYNRGSTRCPLQLTSYGAQSARPVDRQYDSNYSQYVSKVFAKLKELEDARSEAIQTEY